MYFAKRFIVRKIAFKPVLLTEKADIFSIWINDNPFTEFQKFVICFKGSSDPFIADDLERILASIRTIGNKAPWRINQDRKDNLRTELSPFLCLSDPEIKKHMEH